MRLGVLLENEALIDMVESVVVSGLSTRNSILTEVLETVKIL